MTDQRWIVKERNFELDVVKYQVKLNPVLKDQDPLRVDLGNLEIIKKKKAQKKNVVYQKAEPNKSENDKLKEMKKSDSKSSISTTSSTSSNILPYNAKVVDYSQLQYSLIVNKDVNIEGTMEQNWQSLRKNLNDLFCSNFEMKVKSLYSFDFSESQNKNYKIEKGRSRIDELEKNEDDTNAGTVGEIVKKLEIKKKEMLQQWDKEEKVSTLKTIIQCTKILNDVSTPKFYCHKFLLISEFIDNFSKLVYERICKLAFSKQQVDFSKISPQVGNQNAKEVCSNWIMKTCCIRELLPRIYIDISFLGMFKFIMTDEELETKILNISFMIRGISHPLIAFYVSMYLTKIVLTLYPKMKKFLFILLKNLSKFEINEALLKKLKYEDMTVDELKRFLDPCVEWIVYCICKNMGPKDFKTLIRLYDESKNYSIFKGIIIHSLPKFIFDEKIIEYIFYCFEQYNNYESSFLCYLMCQKILITENPLDGKYIAIMWDKIKNCENKELFIDCCSLLGEVLIKFHNEDVQDKFFEEVFEIFKNTFSNSSTAGNTPQEIQKNFAKFEIFLYNILTKITNYNSILSGDNFLFLLQNFNPEMKLNICHTIFKQLINQKEKITDTYLAFSLLKIGKFIHDSIEIFSPQEKRKEVSDILTKFINKIDFGMDFENYLNFLTEARAAYYELDSITELLIKCVQKTAIQTYKSVKGKHNKKTMRFCKVCVAYCLITIPSITSIKTQLKLELTTAEIALMNNLISECDSICKFIITNIQKVMESLDKLEADFIINFSKSFLGFLIMVPSNPDDPFQLIRGFTNLFSLESIPRTLLVLRIKLSLYLSMVKFITTQLQNRLPYHVFNVDSNDEILTGDPKYIQDGNQLVEFILTEILNEISEFDGKISPFDYDDLEFLIKICGNCVEIFKYNFQKTTFVTNVSNKMFELIQKYIGNLGKNNAYGIKDKIEKYKKYFQNLVDT